MSHCGHYEYSDDHGTGVDRCCKCYETWWSEDDPPETECNSFDLYVI